MPEFEKQITKTDIPNGELHDVESLDIEFPELPGEWTWRQANHYTWNHKVNVFFGRNADEPGGWFGEIDNYTEDGTKKWDVHIRTIIDDGTDNGTLAEAPETTRQFSSLDDAITAVPTEIATYYR